MELWELVARESIRDLVARYNSTGDSGRFVETLALFAPDAVMERPDARFEGLAAIEGQFHGAATDLSHLAGPDGRMYLRHFTSSHQIDLVDQTHATGRCYYQVLLPKGLDHWGRYIDEYEERDGRWLFTRRVVTIDGHHAGGMASAFFGE
ncbi:MAG: hypothetical protein JWO68_2621 [Actinomycetia bacterium]|nr:hypothetical protein [Actinomycetes bacterium]